MSKRFPSPWLIVAGGFFVYTLVSVLTLPDYPFVHSDEAWLASLTRTMLEQRSLAATEAFFHLTPRYPHAIKSLYHLLQMPFVGVSFGHVAARLPSLLAGLGALVFLYVAATRIFGDRAAGTSGPSVHGVAVVALLATDPQFVYISHFARQESLLVAVFCASLAYYAACTDGLRRAASPRRLAVLAAILGASIGIHPNAFIVALPFGALVLAQRRPARAALRDVGVVAGVVAGFAAIFVGLSLLMDRQFLAHYLAFGAEVGVTASLPQRAFGLLHFVEKLYHQVAGTYYLAPVRFAMVGFAAGAAIAAVSVAVHLIRRSAGRAESATPGVAYGRLLLAAVSVVLGFFIVGKYSPPSAVLLWPAGVLLTWAPVAAVGQWLQRRDYPYARIAVVAVALAALLIPRMFALAGEVAQARSYDYRGYSAAIRDYVPSDEPVLANLNAGFAFDPKVLHVYRDLAALPESGGGISAFIRGRGIRWILYPSELDRIYAERPVWNDLYGNLYPYYDELVGFLDEQCELVASVETVYAMRIVRYHDHGPHELRVYRVGE